MKRSMCCRTLGIALSAAPFAAACTSAASPDSAVDEDASDPETLEAAHRAPASLVDNRWWQPRVGPDDPYHERLSDGGGCDYTAYGTEGRDPPVLEVITLICDYLTLSQPSEAELEDGDTVQVTLSHGPLAPPENGPAEGFVAVRIGTTEIWSTTVALPATESHSYQSEWTADGSYPVGTPILFHVDNHGTNSWRLLEITRVAR